MKLIFVYNADSGKINTLLDIGHKIISPDTYSCNLCQMTYGIVAEKEEWRKFRESSKNELVFLHRDEFEKQYDEKREYPLVLKEKEGGSLEELVGAEELNSMKGLEELIARLEDI